MCTEKKVPAQKKKVSLMGKIQSDVVIFRELSKTRGLARNGQGVAEDERSPL